MDEKDFHALPFPLNFTEFECAVMLRCIDTSIDIYEEMIKEGFKNRCDWLKPQDALDALNVLRDRFECVLYSD